MTLRMVINVLITATIATLNDLPFARNFSSNILSGAQYLIAFRAAIYNAARTYVRPPRITNGDQDRPLTLPRRQPYKVRHIVFQQRTVNEIRNRIGRTAHLHDVVPRPNRHVQRHLRYKPRFQRTGMQRN